MNWAEIVLRKRWAYYRNLSDLPDTAQVVQLIYRVWEMTWAVWSSAHPEGAELSRLTQVEWYDINARAGYLAVHR